MADVPKTVSLASLSAEGLRQFSMYCQGFPCQLSVFSEPLQDALFSAFSAVSVRHLERGKGGGLFSRQITKHKQEENSVAVFFKNVTHLSDF